MGGKYHLYGQQDHYSAPQAQDAVADNQWGFGRFGSTWRKPRILHLRNKAGKSNKNYCEQREG